jgi:hypothetical protein
MDEPPAPDRGLIFLKWLVIALTATMLAGMVTLIALFVTRLPVPSAPLPENIVLPEGETAAAVTFAGEFIAVVTEGGEILILSPDGQRLRQRIAVER